MKWLKSMDAENVKEVKHLPAKEEEKQKPI